LPTIPAYFSHSYDIDDRELNLFFWQLFYAEDFRLRVDPKSEVLAVHHLEHLMRESASFVSVLTHRPKEPRLRCSPYMVFEYGLALRAKRPYLVFAEKGTSRQLFGGDEWVVPFSRNHLENQRQDFVAKIKQLADRARPDHALDVRQTGTAGLLFDTSQTGSPYTPALLGGIKEVLGFFGFGTEIVPLEFERAHELARRLDDYDFILTDVGAWGPPQWLRGFTSGRFVPTMRLLHLSRNSDDTARFLTPFVRSEFVVTNRSEDAVLAWRDEDELLATLNAQVTHFSKGRTEFRTFEEGAGYLKSTGRPKHRIFVSNAGDANGFVRGLTRAMGLSNFNYFHYKDPGAIPKGDVWRDALKREVLSSTLFLQIVTPGYAASPYCQLELEVAEQRGGALRIIPYILQKVPEKEYPKHQGEDLSLVESDEERVSRILADLDPVLIRANDKPAQLEVAGEAAAESSADTVGEAPGGVDIAILTVTKDEFDAVHKLLQSTELYQPPAEGAPNLHAWTLGKIPTRSGKFYRVVLGMIRRQGNVSSAEATEDTFRIFRPRYVVLAGIAGGLERDGVRRGSVVVSSAIWGYEYGKVNEQGYQPRTDLTFQTDNALVTGALRHSLVVPWHEHPALKAFKIAEQPPNVVEGPIASGEKVVDYIDYPMFQAVLAKWPKLIAIEMEGAGAAAAIARLHEKGERVGFFMIRGISDMPKTGAAAAAATAEQAVAKDSSLAERTNWTPFAAAAAAVFTVSLISQSWPVAPLVQRT